MDVLLVGLDNSLLGAEGASSDTRQRHVDYARTLDEKRPGSHVYMIVQSLASEGLSRERVSDNLTVIPSNSARRELFSLDVLRIGRRLIREHDVNLVTTQSPLEDGLAAYLLCRRYGCAFLPQLRPSNLDDPAWIRERPINRLLRHVGKFVCKRGDGIRVVSNQSEQWCREGLGIPPDRIFLDHISMSMLDPEKYPAPGVETAENRVLYVGRLAPEKDLPTLLKAFERLHADRPETELVVVGGGPEREELETLAADLGVASAVTFEGAVLYEELPAYYDEAGVVVLSSLRETFGRVVLEAFAFGTPVVSTDARGPTELVTPDETGRLVPKRSPSALADALDDVLCDPDERERMGERAQSFVRKNFDPDDLVESLVETWIQVVDRRTTRD